MAERDTFSGWCVLELMGHRRLGGYVTEEQIAGTHMLRVDIHAPESDRVVTQYYSPTALFSMTPTTEDVARSVTRHAPVPVSQFEVGHLLPAPDQDDGS